MKKFSLLALIGLAALVAIAPLILAIVFPSFLDSIIFIGCAFIATTSAVLAVTRHNPMYGILALLAVMLSMSGIFYVLGADLLAVLNLLVYGGAVLMLFLFVIMLFDLGSPDPAAEGQEDLGRETGPEAERKATWFNLNTPKTRAMAFSALLGVFLIGPILKLKGEQWDEFLPNGKSTSKDDVKGNERVAKWLSLEFRQMAEDERKAFNAETAADLDMSVRKAAAAKAREDWSKISEDDRKKPGAREPQPPQEWPGFGQPDRIGMDMFELYLIPFEFVSLIILAGIVGAVVLARRRGTEEDVVVSNSSEVPGSISLVHSPLPDGMELPKPAPVAEHGHADGHGDHH